MRKLKYSKIQLKEYITLCACNSIIVSCSVTMAHMFLLRINGAPNITKRVYYEASRKAH